MTFLKEKRSLHYIIAPKALCKHGLYLAKIPNLFSWREIIFDKRCRKFECFAKSEILHVRHIFFGKINKFLRKNVHEKQTSQPNPSPWVWQNYIHILYILYIQSRPLKNSSLNIHVYSTYYYFLSFLLNKYDTFSGMMQHRLHYANEGGQIIQK